MITELTEAQKARFPEFVDKWLKVGLCTAPIDPRPLVDICNRLYTRLLQREKPQRVAVTKGPADAFMLSVVINDGHMEVLGDVDANGISSVNYDIMNTEFDRINKARNKSEDFYAWPYLDGQFWAAWLSYYDYMQEVLGVKLESEGLDLLREMRAYGLWYTLDSVCVVTERLGKTQLNAQGQLHCDGGPSVVYADGTKVWSLNGVRVPQWLAETPHHKLDPQEFAKIQNVEVRREFVRKFGMEQLCTALNAKLLDSMNYTRATAEVRAWMLEVFGPQVVEKPNDNVYELLTVDLGGNTGVWPYLKMLNPSIGCWHMECVGKDCKTIEEALKFRNGIDGLPVILT